jgi:hypothetical protein
VNLFHQMNKMNTEIKQKWVNALRSGEYEQGSEKLYSGRGYCCLGVLCDLYSKENGLKWEFRGDDVIKTEDEIVPSQLQKFDYFYFDDESEFLPESVKEWAELSAKNPQVRVECEYGEDARFYVDEIANVNDSGYSFTQLAEIIENQF